MHFRISIVIQFVQRKSYLPEKGLKYDDDRLVHDDSGTPAGGTGCVPTAGSDLPLGKWLFW